MGQLTAPDNDQQNPEERNRKLSIKLGAGWVGQHIKSIRREPLPTNPPDPTGPTQGQWVAETVD